MQIPFSPHLLQTSGMPLLQWVIWMCSLELQATLDWIVGSSIHKTHNQWSSLGFHDKINTKSESLHFNCVKWIIFLKIASKWVKGNISINNHVLIVYMHVYCCTILSITLLWKEINKFLTTFAIWNQHLNYIKWAKAWTPELWTHRVEKV